MPWNWQQSVYARKIYKNSSRRSTKNRAFTSLVLKDLWKQEGSRRAAEKLENVADPEPHHDVVTLRIVTLHGNDGVVFLQVVADQVDSGIRIL